MLSNFARDIQELDGYELWRNNPNQKIALDKDLKGNGSKLYSKETCCFLTFKENNTEMINRNKYKNTQKVKCIKPNGEIIIYNSVREVSISENVTQETIRANALGLRKSRQLNKYQYIK